MSNAINRQEVSDYEKHLGAWRKMVEGYSGQVDQYNANAQAATDAYNAKVNAYNASLQSTPYVTGKQMYNRADGVYKLSNGATVPFSAAGNLKVGDPYGAPSVARPGPAPTPAPQPTAPDEKYKPKDPGLTEQQMKDINKSDSPLVDASMNEASDRSVFKPEQGLIARAMAGFKR
jgi:hypothetical protein